MRSSVAAAVSRSTGYAGSAFSNPSLAGGAQTHAITSNLPSGKIEPDCTPQAGEPATFGIRASYKH